MENNNKAIRGLLSKLPYGISCGASAMFVFFATAGLIVSYVVFSGIAAQTSDTVSFLEYSWQTVLFVFDIIFAIITVTTLVAYILKKRNIFFVTKERKGEQNEDI